MKHDPHSPDDKSSGHAHDHDAALGGRAEILFSLLCGALLLAGWLLERSMGGGSRWLVAIVSVYFAAMGNVAFWSQPSPAVSCSNSPTHCRSSARIASTSSSSSRMSARQSDRLAPGAPPVKDESLSTVCSIP